MYNDVKSAEAVRLMAELYGPYAEAFVLLQEELAKAQYQNHLLREAAARHGMKVPPMERHDRRVHAYTDEWEIVRYDRAGKWFAEWKGEGSPPSHVDRSVYNTWVNSRGRANLTVKTAAQCAVRLGATHRPGLPGGRVFDNKVHEQTWLAENRS